MFTFRFKVESPKGEVRIGKISAQSEGRARYLIESKGYTVVSLQLHIDEALDIKTKSSRFRGLKFDPPENSDYAPSLSERLHSFLDDETLLKKLFWIILVLGGVVFVVFFGLPDRQQAPSKPFVMRTVAISGRFVTPITGEDTLVISFPDIPLIRSYPAEQVVKEDATYRVVLEFESRESPVSAQVHLQTPEGDKKGSRFTLSGTPLSGVAPDL